MVGRFVRAPEKFNNDNGVKFTLAETVKYKKKSGDIAEETCFIDVTSFIAVDAISKHKKGYLIGVTGRLRQEHWEKDGQKHSKHVIVVKEVTFYPNEKNEKRDKNTGDKGGESDKESEGAYPPEWDTAATEEQWN